ncbi:permease-like cell division protein FtsX [Streptosporangium sp. NPDC000396]|uniref:permease-like cell division protein FtsX n=1 Tax=Streptosporangium sp. NPDC000396 TaxID=3366185 RepID=UPI00368B48C9
MTAVENRLRDALSAAATTAVDVRPLAVPARRRFRIPMMLAAVATVIAVGTGFLWVRQADPETSTTAQATSVPGREEISVFLCARNSPFPQCKGQKADKAKIAEALRSRPDVERIRFESKAEAYKNFRANFKNDSVLLAAVRLEDMPESFRVVPRSGADRAAIIAAAEKVPGVITVIDDMRCRTREEKC